MDRLQIIVEDNNFYSTLFGDNPHIIHSKRSMLETVWKIFRKRFPQYIRKQKTCLISVPNRVELLGKHTDYQGGETFLLTGPRNFFAICALSDDGASELINAHPDFGETVFKLRGRKPEMMVEGEGANYTYTVAKRLLNNLSDSGLSHLHLKDVKSVFFGDIPFGGGTSGSSAKLITDFFILASVNGLLTDRDFISLVIENGKKAGLSMGTEEADDFSLALSMYLAHHENGFDFGDLKGDRGVGTFGGSEDHTAILLGERNRLLYCRYCPTEVIEKVDMPQGYMIAVAYSGKKAEKTKEAMLKYNRLSEEASAAVGRLNEINRTDFSLLRDFFQELPAHERAGMAYEQLSDIPDGVRLAERAYQFFKETCITAQAVKCLKEGQIKEFGTLINESHDLSKNYLKNIVPEIDFLQRSANNAGAAGATGFGAGFGGSCYAIVRESHFTDFIEKWKEEYIKKYPQFKDLARFDVYSACRGVFWENVIR